MNYRYYFSQSFTLKLCPDYRNQEEEPILLRPVSCGVQNKDYLSMFSSINPLSIHSTFY